MFSRGGAARRRLSTLRLTAIRAKLYFLRATNQSGRRGRVTEAASNRRMRLTSERSWAKMAAGSDLLDDVFFNTEVDEKVVSDLVGSLESELSGAARVNAAARVQPAANHAGPSAAGGDTNVQGSKMGLSQQELAKAGKRGALVSRSRSRCPTAGR